MDTESDHPSGGSGETAVPPIAPAAAKCNFRRDWQTGAAAAHCRGKINSLKVRMYTNRLMTGRVAYSAGFNGGKRTVFCPRCRRGLNCCQLRAAQVVLLLWLATSPCWSAVQAELVAPGVYVVLQPFGERFNDSNSTILILNDSVAVVDTQTTLTATRVVLEQIRQITDKPVRWVINTHWHGDHVQGNQVYRAAFPGVQFLSQTKTREDMAQRATAELKDQVVNLPGKIEKYRKMLDSGHAPNGESLTEQQRRLLELRVSTFSAQLPDLRQTHIVLPDVTFDHCLSLYGGNREVRLTHYDGHTRGDVVVFLPAEKVLITGDLVDDMPYTGDGSPAELVKTLHELDQLDFDVMIPGHGAIKRGHTHLRQVTQLMEFIVSQVRENVRSGLSLEDTKRKIDVEQFRIPMTAGEEHATRAFDAFVPVAVERAYLEAKETANQ